MKQLLKLSVIALSFASLTACPAKENTVNQNALAINVKNTPKPSKKYIKVALLLDTSNSMDGLIDQAKAQLWEIVNELSYAKCEDEKPNLQIALYEYGNDKLNADEGYIRQVLAFSEDLDDISKELFSLTTKGGNEYCGQVIDTALDQLQWNENKDDLKLIFIAGNEPFNQGTINYKTAAKKAHDKNVTINTIFCGNYEGGIASYWKDGADLAHGNYMAINHNHATVHVASPYDDEILNLNRKLNKTYVAYGNLGRTKMMLQAEQDVNAEGYSSANAVSRTVSKSSHLYKNESWDLVDASKDKKFKYEAIKESQLPTELKGKSTSEIKAYVAKKKKERKAIQNKIQQLNSKRKQYLSSQKNDTENALESAMIKAIKTQAKDKNYNWE
ncbi:vWA domain-containing protein [Lacinutrix salivirga]